MPLHHGDTNGKQRIGPSIPSSEQLLRLFDGRWPRKGQGSGEGERQSQELLQQQRHLLTMTGKPSSCDVWDGPIDRGATGGRGPRLFSSITDRLSQQAPSLQFGNWHHASAKVKFVSSASSTRPSQKRSGAGYLAFLRNRSFYSRSCCGMSNVSPIQRRRVKMGITSPRVVFPLFLRFFFFCPLSFFTFSLD